MNRQFAWFCAGIATAWLIAAVLLAAWITSSAFAVINAILP